MRRSSFGENNFKWARPKIHATMFLWALFGHTFHPWQKENIKTTSGNYYICIVLHTTGKQKCPIKLECIIRLFCLIIHAWFPEIRIDPGLCIRPVFLICQPPITVQGCTGLLTFVQLIPPIEQLKSSNTASKWPQRSNLRLQVKSVASP